MPDGNVRVLWSDDNLGDALAELHADPSAVRDDTDPVIAADIELGPCPPRCTGRWR